MIIFLAVLGLGSLFNLVTKLVESMVEVECPKQPPVPPTTSITKGPLRPGLCPTRITGEILKRKIELGIPISTLPDGSPSLQDKADAILIEEIVKDIVANLRITVEMQPNSISVLTTGANAGGPIITIGTTTTQGIGYGTAQ